MYPLRVFYFSEMCEDFLLFVNTLRTAELTGGLDILGQRGLVTLGLVILCFEDEQAEKLDL